jgi:hypothetical protein
MVKKQTSDYKERKDAQKAQARKDMRSGKFPAGNSPHEPNQKVGGSSLRVNVPKRKM